MQPDGKIFKDSIIFLIENWVNKMIGWLVLVVLVILILVFLKVGHMRHKTYAILLVLLMLFLYFTGSKIIADNNLNVKTFSGMVTAGKLYFSWLGQAFKNMKVVVGNVVKMEWSANSTAK